MKETSESNQKRPRNVEKDETDNAKDSKTKKKRVGCITGKENLSPYMRSGKGRGRSGLPYWYPRKPLQDITAIVRAIENTRKRFGETELLLPSTPMFHEQTVHDPSAVSSSSHAPIKHDISMGKEPKILPNITNQNNGGSDCLVPQKKLLTDSDTVDKEVKEEVPKLKRTPSANKSEREKRVRTLMSMR